MLKWDHSIYYQSASLAGYRSPYLICNINMSCFQLHIYIIEAKWNSQIARPCMIIHWAYHVKLEYKREDFIFCIRNYRLLHGEHIVSVPLCWIQTVYSLHIWSGSFWLGFGQYVVILYPFQTFTSFLSIKNDFIPLHRTSNTIIIVCFLIFWLVLLLITATRGRSAPSGNHSILTFSGGNLSNNNLIFWGRTETQINLANRGCKFDTPHFCTNSLNRAPRSSRMKVLNILSLVGSWMMYLISWWSGDANGFDI